MRTERVQESKRAKSGNGLVGALMGLVLVVGAIISMGAPTKHANAETRMVQPRAAQLDAVASDRVSSDQANADRDTLDLQLD